MAAPRPHPHPATLQHRFPHRRSRRQRIRSMAGRRAFTVHATTGRIDDVVTARRAYDAVRRKHHLWHPRVLTATADLATALHRAGRYEEAVALRCELTVAYDELGHRSDSLTTRAGLAASMHAAGYCDEAANVIGAAWLLWRLRPDTCGGRAVGAVVLRIHLRALAGCRRLPDYDVALAQALRASLFDASSDAASVGLLPDANYIDKHKTACAHRPRDRESAGHAEPRQPP
jgi:hypothetical protein